MEVFVPLFGGLHVNLGGKCYAYILFYIFTRCPCCFLHVCSQFLFSQKLTIDLTFPVIRHFTYLRSKGECPSFFISALDHELIHQITFICLACNSIREVLLKNVNFSQTCCPVFNEPILAARFPAKES